MSIAFEALQRVFRPQTLVLLHAETVEVPPRASRRQVAISRAITPYKRLALPAGVPGDKRLDALKLQALEWSPYARTEMMFDLAEHGAGVWIWDKDRVDSLLAAAGRDPRQVRTT